MKNVKGSFRDYGYVRCGWLVWFLWFSLGLDCVLDSMDLIIFFSQETCICYEIYLCVWISYIIYVVFIDITYLPPSHTIIMHKYYFLLFGGRLEQCIREPTQKSSWPTFKVLQNSTPCFDFCPSCLFIYLFIYYV
jgi:hypothetical protein